MKIAQPALMIQDKPTPVQNDWHTLRQCQKVMKVKEILENVPA